MSVVLTLIAIAALALCLLVWLISRLRDGGAVRVCPSRSTRA